MYDCAVFFIKRCSHMKKALVSLLAAAFLMTGPAMAGSPASASHLQKTVAKKTAGKKSPTPKASKKPAPKPTKRP
jgi:hypothetical protein